MTAAQFHASDGVDDWRVLYHVVSAHFRTGSLLQGATLADRIARLTGDKERFVKVDLRQAGVTVSITGRDADLARGISTAARELGLTADPTAVQLVHISIDALVSEDVMP